MRAFDRCEFVAVAPQSGNNITTVAQHGSPRLDRSRISRYHTRSTKLSTTRFSPALSNAMVSLLPSMAVTLPLPNFRWKTRSPTAKAETVPVDLATSSPSMVSGPRRRSRAKAARRLAAHPPPCPSPSRGEGTPVARPPRPACACARVARRRARRPRRSRAVASSKLVLARTPSFAVVAGARRFRAPRLRALPAGRRVARAEMRHLVEARAAGVAVGAHARAPKPPLASFTSTCASGSSSRKRDGMLDDHRPCMRRLAAK